MKKETILPFLALFTSLSTILCCALPILLVTLGMGAVFASLTANFPALTLIASYSLEIFILATILLLVSGYFIFIKAQTCPSDKNLAKLCAKTKKINKVVWIASVVILCISAFFKYALILFY
ncbi:MAG: mercuric ion transport protein [Candidatus Deianiraeaceae bacterium]|jgi:mercuric ion transport protein